MIIDVLENKIKEMQELRRLEEIKRHEEAQKKVDAKYRSLVEQVRTFSKALKYASDELGFGYSSSLRDSLRGLLGELKSIVLYRDWKTTQVQAKLAEKEEVEKAEKHFSSIKSAIKNEWKTFYTKYTRSSISTLKVCLGIAFDPAAINRCLAVLNRAGEWTTDLNVLKSLKEAKENAEKLIGDLGLDDDAIGFLNKMTQDKATLFDLNENVLRWIRQKGLEGKIKLSFK